HALRHKNKDADRLANQAMDRGMKRSSTTNPATNPNTPNLGAPQPALSLPKGSSVADMGEAAPKARPYPTKSETPPDPYSKADTMLRGFTKDGVVHILGNATLPDGVFVKIIRE